ncbi:MAG: hypothetical protein K0U38_00025 [Epsilonproteobacteria bacterium]|nr:hypothetical protein [Campylobacterota bacterium]
MKFLLFLLISMTLPIYANPVVVGFESFLHPIFQFCLFGEALVIALMLTNHHFYFFKTLITWHIITFFTFVIFSILLMVIGGSSSVSSQIGSIVIIIVLEVFIIYVESTFIIDFSITQFYCKAPKKMSAKEAFKISLIGNLTSIYMGVIAGFSAS